ncbi:Myomesin-1 [Frankliniella fusca]|uniref:Myomesin-1 n=1 Tax=Frankliniella fusca TaxID=407009 RepID=A0AAE1LB26_9NEOP|nr:Myomesin-1 [Frankliniella fusca]
MSATLFIRVLLVSCGCGLAHAQEADTPVSVPGLTPAEAVVRAGLGVAAQRTRSAGDVLGAYFGASRTLLDAGAGAGGVIGGGGGGLLGRRRRRHADRFSADLRRGEGGRHWHRDRRGVVDSVLRRLNEDGIVNTTSSKQEELPPPPDGAAPPEGAPPDEQPAAGAPPPPPRKPHHGDDDDFDEDWKKHEEEFRKFMEDFHKDDDDWDKDFFPHKCDKGNGGAAPPGAAPPPPEGAPEPTTPPPAAVIDNIS